MSRVEAIHAVRDRVLARFTTSAAIEPLMREAAKSTGEAAALARIGIGDAYRVRYREELARDPYARLQTLVRLWEAQTDEVGEYLSRAASVRAEVLREVLNERTGCDPELLPEFDAVLDRVTGARCGELSDEASAIREFHAFYRRHWLAGQGGEFIE